METQDTYKVNLTSKHEQKHKIHTDKFSSASIRLMYNKIKHYHCKK